MILIDFDKLMEAYNDFFDEFAVHDLRYLKKKCLPIVEAIPVEWIEKYAKRTSKKCCHCATAIWQMLEEWEKENGEL